ncbi:NmrA family transcriptional regulator [Modestobacter caceresii]|uniref:NmrA family transcriptional regulator n=1 Tax=Modestobacter caceresii TaxID=1522368 RepID=A0A098Y0K8_9ACTN|nr:NAD(P)H-binding protein [Modestobacter caceresii]KGH44483.1 NmrA family transcriptional regulator [Modestobacter caceresii]
MRIVVTTPTGHVGSRVVRLLLQAGLRPTLLLRSPEKLDPQTRERVDLVVGDQGDLDTVLRATEGADALYWVDPPTLDDDPVATSTRMGAVAARAVRENQVSRVVFQSSVGAEKRHGVGQIDGLARTEEQLEETGAPVLHLRCGYFFTNLLSDLDGLRDGVLRTTMPTDRPMPWVDPRDIGEVAVANLLSPGWPGRRVLAVHGPEDLTFEAVAGIVAAATGRAVRAEQINDDDLRAGLRAAGLSEAQVEGFVGMGRGLREDFVPADPRSVLSTTPTTLRSWAVEELAPHL